MGKAVSAEKIDLEGGTYYSEEYGFGFITNMFDAGGEETIDPRECFACVVRLGPNKWLSREVLADERAVAVH